MTNTTTPIPPEDERRGLGKILLTVFGSVGALVALALLVAAAALGIAHTQRDPNGPLYRNPRGETAPPQPLGPEPQIVTPDEDDSEPADETPDVAPTPANPFGVPFGSSGRPGVVTPAPQQPQQQGPQGQQR